MSEVFYRKWRPRRLDQVVGQEPVTHTLRQAVSLGRVAHAYLFCGPRGTGKTSTARILAKAVNCAAPQTGEPDDECEMCRAINEGRALDLIEIDAASNRGIDDIRNLSDKIHFSPNQARYKVYVIDEVHMLTEPAFNALLKTLEEPPEHAIFVLATTEAHKVPATIISRCQRFDFRRITLESIGEKLTELCKGEEIEASPEALALIGRTARGSLRDAENLLEQAVVSYGSPVSETQVRELLGLGGDEMALELVDHVMKRSVSGGLKVINRVAGEGNDLRQLHRGLMEYLRALLLQKSGAEPSLGYPDDTMTRIRSLADTASMAQVLHVLKSFGSVDLRQDGSSPLPLELAMVESATELSVGVEAERPAQVEARELPRSYTAQTPTQPARAARPTRAAQPAGTAPAAQRGEPPQSAAGPAAIGTALAADATESVPSEPAARLESQWRSIAGSLRHVGKRFKLGALLRGCRDRDVSDGVVTLKFPYASHVERLQEELDAPETRNALEEALAEAMDAPYKVKVALVTDNNSRPGERVAHRSHLVRSAQTMGARVVDEKGEES